MHAVLPVWCVLPNNLAHALVTLYPSVLLTLLSGLIASHSTHGPSTTPFFLSLRATSLAWSLSNIQGLCVLIAFLGSSRAIGYLD